jgi:altronate dehydratase small subunit
MNANSSANPSAKREAIPRGLRLHAADNVVTALESVPPGPLTILGDAAAATVDVVEPIVAGHKVALQPIAVGESVVKYGVTIGLATEPIAAGTWVHTHNCRSRIDERSHTLDRHTGAPTDMQYK